MKTESSNHADSLPLSFGEAGRGYRKYEIILASKSPRRQQLLHDLGIEFTVQSLDIPEKFPEGLGMTEIPVYLAELKASAFLPLLQEDQLVITADTIVWLNGRVLNKPANFEEGFHMLKALSGAKHEVVTGVCLLTTGKRVSFFSVTDVWFKELSDEEIRFYLENYKPYDKAGAYGIQEWIGYVAITRIEGSFFNVMGLPIQQVYEHLRTF